MKLVHITLTDTLKQIFRSMSNTYATLLMDEKGIPADQLVDDYVDYLSLSTDHTKISYVHPPKDGDVLAAKRYSCKPGALLQKVFKNLDMRQVENFSNQFKAWASLKDFEFSVVEGEDIIKWYYEDFYEGNVPRNARSSLHASCMKYHKCGKYLRVYAKNPDKIKMLILTNQNGNLVGRALLWYISDDLKVMDRIYTYDDEKLPSMFMNWADSNGFIYKFFQRWNNNAWFGSKGEKVYKEITFDFEIDKSNFIPYFDTFKFYNFKTKQLSNSPFKTSDQIILISPEGSYNSDGDYIKQDYFTKEYNYRHEMWLFDYIKDKEVWANRHSDNVVHSYANDTYILREDAENHPHVGWIFKERSLNKASTLDTINRMEERRKNVFPEITREEFEVLAARVRNHNRVRQAEMLDVQTPEQPSLDHV